MNFNFEKLGVGVITYLEKAKTEKRLKADVKTLKEINIPAVLKLNKTRTKTQLKKDIESVAATVDLTAKASKKGLSTSVKDVVKHAQEIVNKSDIKLNIGGFDNKKLDDIITQLKQLSQSGTLDTAESVNAINREAQAMLDIIDNARKAALEKLEFAEANREVRESADNTADAIIRERNAMNSMDDIHYILENVNLNAQQGDSVFRRFGNTLNEAFATYTIANLLEDAIYEIIDAGKEGIEVVKELNDVATSLRMATGGSLEETNALVDSYNDLGQELGAITRDVSESADAWLRQGHSIADTNTLITDSMMLSKIANLESAESTEYLTSIMQAYRLSADEVVNTVSKLSAVDLESASDAGGLAKAMSRCASAAQMAGVSMDTLIGYIATVKEVTQDSDEAVGNMFKSIFSRMNQIRAGKFVDLETGESLNDTEKVLNKIGIVTRDLNNQLIDSEQILDSIGRSWNEYDSNTQKALATAVAGTYQYNKFISLMQSYSDAMKYANISANSQGTAEEKFGYYLDSLESKTNSLKASLENLATTTFSDELYASVLDTSKVIVDMIADTGILKGLLSGLGTSGALYGFQQITNSLGDITQGFANLNEAMNMTRGGIIANRDDMQRLVGLTGGLSQSQTRLLLSTNNLTDAQKIAILMNQGLTQAEAQQTIQTWGVATAQNGATAATITFTGALRGLWATLMANPLILVTTLISAGVMAYDAYNKKVEETKQQFADLKTEVSQIESELSSLNTQLQTTVDRMNELESKDSLTFTEKEEYDNLVKQNNELQRSIDLLELEQKTKSKELNKAFVNTMVSDTKDQFEYTKDDSGNVFEGNSALYKMSDGSFYASDETEYIERQFALHKEYSDKLAKLNAEEVNATDEQKKEIAEEIETLETFIGEIETYLDSKSTEFSTTASEISYISNPTTEDEKAVNEWLDYIADFQDRMAIAMGGSNAKENAFNRLVDNWQFDDTMQGLQDLGEQGKVTADMLNAPKYDVFINKLVELGVIDSADNLEDIALAFNKVLEASENANKTETLSFEENISQVQSLSKGLDELAKVYADVKDGEGFDFSSILNNEDFKALFGSYTEEYENFIKTVSESPDDINACQEAFNDLATAYVYGQDALKNVTDETLDSTVAILKQMGVTNAEEVATDALTRKKADLAAQEWLSTQTKYDLVNATNKDIESLLTEAQSAEIDSVAIAELVANEIMLNNNNLDVSQKLNALAQVAYYANLATVEIEALNEAMSGGGKTKKAFAEENGIKVISVKNRTDGETNKGWQYEYNGTAYENLDEAYLAQQYDSLKAQFDKPISIDLPTVSFDGTTGNYSSSSSSSTKEFEETIDFFEEHINNLNDAISILDANLENVSGSAAKNALIGQEINLNVEKINGYSSALAMYSQKANEALAQIPMDLWGKVTSGAVDVSTFVGEGNESVVNAIQEYQTWKDKIIDCTQQLAELKEAIAQLELEKFKNIGEDFSNLLGIYENSNSLIDKQISLFEEAGELIGESFYTAQIEQAEKQLTILEQEKLTLSNQLASALASGNIQTGSDEWLEMVNILSDLDGQILDCKTSIEKWNNAILEIDTEIFERIQEQFSNIDSELENLRNLFENFDVATSDGEWTNEGLAQLGLLTQQYELAIYQAQQYGDEIAQLNKDYSEGKYSTTEYTDKLAELTTKQWDAINASEDAKDAIVALNEARIDVQIDGIEKEKEAYKELIDAQIEALEAEKDLHDYRKSIEEQTENLTDLERQRAALEHDNSASGIAQKKILEDKIAKAKDELEETQYDHSVEAQKNALNEQYEDFENEKDDEIEKLKETLENREQLIAASFNTVKQNANTIGQEISNIANQHGIAISDSIVTSWQSGENAIANYGSVLTPQTSNFVSQLVDVETQVYNLQTQANSTATSLITMFSTRADNLINELVNSYYSIGNVNTVTNALQSSLVNTLGGTYDVSGITSALNSITNAAYVAKQAIDNLNSTSAEDYDAPKKETGYTMNQNAQTGYYEIIDKSTGSVVSKHRTQRAAENAYSKLPKYASGTRNAKGGLAITDEDGYELKLPKLINGNYTIVGDGDQILTKAQTDNIFDWAKFNPIDIVPQFSLPSMKVPEFTSRNVQPTVNVHYDNFMTVNGDINDTNHFTKQVESIANRQIAKDWKGFINELRY